VDDFEQANHFIVLLGVQHMKIKAVADELFATLSLECNRKLFADHPHAERLWKIVDEYKVRYDEARNYGRKP
jgi:hypothetical protein